MSNIINNKNTNDDTNSDWHAIAKKQIKGGMIKSKKSKASKKKSKKSKASRKISKKSKKSKNSKQSYDEKNYNDGIHRRIVKDTFEYYYIATNKVVTKKDQERINKLRIPPAWINTWISIDPKSSIQVIGLDNKNRKQYLYHQEHIAEAEKQKFINLIDFIKAMPKLNRVLKNHEKLSPYNKLRVIVTMLMLVKKLHLRVGKDQYAKTNKSYGVSSLEKRHVVIDNNKIKLRFRGKSKQILTYSLEDNVVVNHLNLLLKLEGDKLFQYIDDHGVIRKVTDLDLNNYIQEHTSSEFSVKDFRTMASNVHFVTALMNETKKHLPVSEKVIKKNISNAITKSSSKLKHTKAVSKSSYVSNFIIEMYENDPDWFVNVRDDDPTDILLNLLQMYKKEILDDK